MTSLVVPGRTLHHEPHDDCGLHVREETALPRQVVGDQVGAFADLERTYAVVQSQRTRTTQGR